MSSDNHWLNRGRHALFQWVYGLLTGAGASGSVRQPTDMQGLLAASGDIASQDLALARLIEHYVVDDQSCDLYMTLGAAFRRNGEYSRSIAVHETLCNCEALCADSRRRATLQLAADYSGAGMLDRAEALLLRALAANPADAENRSQLLRLYEKQQDWRKALHLAESGATKSSLPSVELAAQYCCELAMRERQSGNIKEEREWLQEALKRERNSARALVMLCENAVTENDHHQALAYFHQVERFHATHAPELAAVVFRQLRASGERKLLTDHLNYITQRRNSYTVVKLARDTIQELQGEKAAERFFLEQIARRPSLKALYDWAERELKVTKSREKDKIEAIVHMLRGVVDEKAVYQCVSCGYRCNELQWRCPGCESWKSVQMIIGAEGE